MALRGSNGGGSGATSLVGPANTSLYKKPAGNATRQVATRQQVIANGAVGYTYHNNIVTEAEIVSLRPMFNNVNTVALTGVLWAIAPTADFSAINTPTGAWINGTFSSTSSSTGTILARLAAEQPSLTYGDWTDVSSIAPTDGGLYKYCIRHFVPAANTTTSEGFYPLSNFFHTSSAANGGRIFQTFRQDVDGVTNKAAFTQTTLNTTPGLLMGWQYQLRSGRIVTLMGSGDSITEGAVNGATGNFGNGWQWQSVMLFRAAYPGVLLEYANYGISSQNTTTFSQLAIERIPRIEPDLVIYSPFSPNDGTPITGNVGTQAVLASNIQTTARLYNVPVCYVGGCPNTTAGWTAPQDAIRRFSNRFFRGNSRMTRGYIDPDPSLWDGVAAYKAGVSTDGTHPNEAGAGALAADSGFASLRLSILGI